MLNEEVLSIVVLVAPNSRKKSKKGREQRKSPGHLKHSISAFPNEIIISWKQQGQPTTVFLSFTNNESGYHHHEDQDDWLKHQRTRTTTSFIYIPGDGSRSEGTYLGGLEHVSSSTVFENERVHILDTASHHILIYLFLLLSVTDLGPAHEVLITYYTYKWFKDSTLNRCDDGVVQHRFESDSDEHNMCGAEARNLDALCLRFPNIYIGHPSLFLLLPLLGLLWSFSFDDQLSQTFYCLSNQS